MIVLIDIGNTRTKFCIVNNGTRGPQQAILNKNVSESFLNENFSKAQKIIVASVSHYELAGSIEEWSERQEIIYVRVVSELQRNNILNGYQVESQLGVDRWLALIGAGILFPRKNILIVDSGTATTIDLLTANGQHQGGWILAGINTLLSSVLADTAQVSANKKETVSLAFGLNTSENVHNAAWAATVGMINLAVSHTENQGIVIDEVIFTGGNADLLSSLSLIECEIIEELVMIGLQAYI